MCYFCLRWWNRRHCPPLAFMGMKESLLSSPVHQECSRYSQGSSYRLWHLVYIAPAGGTWGEAAGLDCSRYVSDPRPELRTPPPQTFPSKPAQELSPLSFPVSSFCLSDPAGRGPEHILACTFPNPTPRVQSFCETEHWGQIPF